MSTLEEFANNNAFDDVGDGLGDTTDMTGLGDTTDMTGLGDTTDMTAGTNDLDDTFSMGEGDDEKSRKWIVWVVLAALLAAIVAGGVVYYVFKRRRDAQALADAQGVQEDTALTQAALKAALDAKEAEVRASLVEVAKAKATLADASALSLSKQNELALKLQAKQVELVNVQQTYEEALRKTREIRPPPMPVPVVPRPIPVKPVVPVKPSPPPNVPTQPVPSRVPPVPPPKPTPPKPTPPKPTPPKPTPPKPTPPKPSPIGPVISPEANCARSGKWWDPRLRKCMDKPGPKPTPPKPTPPRPTPPRPTPPKPTPPRPTPPKPTPLSPAADCVKRGKRWDSKTNKCMATNQSHCTTGKVWDAKAGKCMDPKPGPKPGPRPGPKPGPKPGPTPSGAKLGDFIMTWYSYQDNTPCNTDATSSGRKLVAYSSVAMPFRYLKDRGGPLSYGDKLYVKFLAGRRMPDGKTHTGWVQLDDKCGDHGDDSYCFQRPGGKECTKNDMKGCIPNVDLYIGDYTKAGMSCSGGPAGRGQEHTAVHRGPAPAGKWISNYGGRDKGTGKRCDCSAAKREPPACAWHYTPTYEKWWDSVCK